jgi:CRP-like cAMP-binding protein
VARAKKKKLPFHVNSFLSKADGGRTIRSYRKNEKIFSQNDRADAVFYIQEGKGKVKVYVISEAGKEAVVALHGKGDFFGEGCLTGQPLRLATVAAMTECVIMRLAKADIVRVLRDEPKFSERFMSYLSTRNARVEEDLVDQLFNSSEKRLARVLLLMANFGKEGKPEPVITKISQETLAHIVGTTRSRDLAPPNRGSFNSTHVYGTHVPVEEPSTASIPEVTRFARISRSGYPPTVGGPPVYWPFVSLI